MQKLEACRAIQKELKANSIGRQELEAVNLWNAYKRMIAHIKSEGVKKGISDEKLILLSKVANLSLKVTIDYDFII